MADESQCNEGPKEPTHHPQPLDYGRPAPSDSAGKVFATLGGGIVSIVIVAILGAALCPYPIGGPSLSATEKVRWGGVAGFLALGAVGIVGAVLLWHRRPLGHGGWFLAGALIGVGITCLLEGVCYASP